MKLYVTRHGQSELNALNLVCGSLDAGLTDRGVEQAKELAWELKGCKIDVIISSPLKRAKRTADILSGSVGVPVITDGRLMEHNFGTYEGTSRSSEVFHDAKLEFMVRFPKGESIFDVVHRVYNFLDEIKERYPAQTVLLVCHGETGRVIHTYFHDVTIDEFKHLPFHNCELKEYEI